MSHSPPPPYEARPDISSGGPKGLESGNYPTFPPQPQFSAPIAPSAPTAVIPTIPVTRVVCTRASIFGPFPVEMDCSYCHQHIVTHTSRVPGALPWIIFSVCFVLGFFLIVPWCLCCLPFCIDSCLDVLHCCPSCKRLVGRFSRL